MSASGLQGPRVAAEGELLDGGASEPRESQAHAVLPRVDASGGPISVHSLALTGLLVLAVFYTLYFARPILMPITVALLTSMLLTPPVRYLSRLRVPQALAAALVVGGVLATLTAGIYLLAEPAQKWVERAPQDLRTLEHRLRAIKEPLENVREAADKVDDIARVDGKSGRGTIAIEPAGPTSIILAATPSALAALFTLIVLVYFSLAAGNSFLRKLVRLLPRLEDKKRAVDTVRTVQADISHYLLTITLINATLGLLTALSLWALEVPNPLLWGTVVALLNFAPFVGPAVSVALLTGVSLLSFSNTGEALAVPGIYLVLTIVEGQIVTPLILGQRLALSPMAIFVMLMLLGWMWGIPGALIAVPLLVCAKIFCERIDGLKPFADFLAR